MACVERVRRTWADGPPGLRWAGPAGRVVLGLAVSVASVVGLVGVAFVAGRAAVADLAHSVDVGQGPLALPPLAQRSVAYAADGSVLAVLHDTANRQPVGLNQVAPVAVQAVIDTEDARYWQHGALDARSVVRALQADYSSGRAVEGGSTIAQQLVKNTLLNSERSIGRKVKELVLAARLERQLGRYGVLERYLNTVYFGQGAYGIESAAETYFGVAASQLDAGQAALLAGLIQQPDGYDPIRAPDAARQRRQTVLDRMVGHGHLAPGPARTAAAEPLPAKAIVPPQGRDYFTDAVRQSLLSDRRLGATLVARERALYSGGLRIRTTLDPAQQRSAEAAISGGVPQVGRPLTAAIAAVDPGSGAVRAVVGGSNFDSSQFDAAVDGGRQAGSSFKVFTLVAALEQGYSPGDFIDGSSPCVIPNPGGVPDPWTPSNFEGEAFGQITLNDATARSVNCAYARLAMMVGFNQVAQVAHQMGVTSALPVVPSMTLGTDPVTPLEMASAYATLAAGGIYHRPHLVDEVDGADGRVLIKDDAKPQRVMSSQIAAEAGQVLQQVVQQGTGQAANVTGWQVAGKTGTAENYQDAWFVGYTPVLSAAVWMGDLSGEVPMVGVDGINVVGGSFPARMWSAFATQALAGTAPQALAAPDPGQVPAATALVPGQPRGSGAPESHPPVTTWCWSSCGH